MPKGGTRMTRWLLVGAALLVAQGCATQLDGALRFQHSSIEPEAGEAFVPPADLRPGDIILTSQPTLRSAGIQLMTFAPVSHAAVYVGNGQVVEAVGSGVRVRTLEELMEEEGVALALRHPELSAEQAQVVRSAALEKVGRRFNYVGVALHLPFSINRRLCELPLVPTVVRDACVRGVGAIHHLVTSSRALFCSQLVLQSYRQAGVPITDADPRLISPADILHMREGDVPSVRVNRPLQFVGHLKYELAEAIAAQR